MSLSVKTVLHKFILYFHLIGWNGNFIVPIYFILIFLLLMFFSDLVMTSTTRSEFCKSWHSLMVRDIRGRSSAVAPRRGGVILSRLWVGLFLHLLLHVCMPLFNCMDCVLFQYCNLILRTHLINIHEEQVLVCAKEMWSWKLLRKFFKLWAFSC